MKKRGEQGSFTIEAALVLPIFMVAYIAIVSLALIARVESTTQYAIDQVAKEISRYCYIAEKANLLVEHDDAQVNSVDDAVGAMYDFTSALGDMGTKYTPGTFSKDLGSVLSSFGTEEAAQDFEKVSAAAKSVYTSFRGVLDDPKGTIVALAQMAGDKGVSALVSRIIANPLCRVLMPKYLTAGGDPDETLKKWGIENGFQDLDFSMSTFLMDDRTINVVVVYPIKLNGFGIFDQTLVIKQTASTAAWAHKKTSISAVASSLSKWKKGDLERGKDFVAELKAQNPHKGVAAGIGIDLYDQSSNTFTSVHSINVFNPSYSDYDKNGGKGAACYTLKKDAIKATVRSYANKLKTNIGKGDEFITMEDGTQMQTAKEAVRHRSAELRIVLPEEAKECDLATLNAIAREIEDEIGVKVALSYRENALGG